MSKTTKIEKAAPQALAVPSFIKQGDRRGTENITSSDVRPPALRIAQGQSPETKRQDAKYIDGLREGEFFNSVTREIYGEGPLRLIVVNQLGHRHVEFAPMSEGGGVIDFNVPDGDERTEFTTVVKDGKSVRQKPRATKFYDYLVLLILGEGETERRVMMTVSLKSTQLKKAVTLNTLLKGSNLPSFAFLFNVTAVPENRSTYQFYGWRFDQVGYVSEAQYNAASAVFDELVGKTVTVETEDDRAVADDDDDTPF